MTYNDYCLLIESRMSVKRYGHSLAVAKKAVELAEILGADVEKCRMAGILHDIAKELPSDESKKLIKKYNIKLNEIELKTPKLWHAILGSEICKRELNILDKDILNAIRYHTTGRAEMSLVEKIIFTADFVSDERGFEYADELKLAVSKDFEYGIIECTKFTINWLIKSGDLIHIDTIMAHNDLISKKK